MITRKASREVCRLSTSNSKEKPMIALEDLGRKMGADPSSWQTEIPSIYWKN
jgi:hypothetical protein